MIYVQGCHEIPSFQGWCYLTAITCGNTWHIEDNFKVLVK